MMAFEARMLLGRHEGPGLVFKSDAGPSFNTGEIDGIANVRGRGPARI